MSKGPHWKAEEDAVLHRMLTATPTEVAACLPGRTGEAVAMRRKRLRLVQAPSAAPPGDWDEGDWAGAPPDEEAADAEAAAPPMRISPEQYRAHGAAILQALDGFGLDQLAYAWVRSNGASQDICLRALAGDPQTHPARSAA